MIEIPALRSSGRNVAMSRGKGFNELAIDKPTDQLINDNAHHIYNSRPQSRDLVVAETGTQKRISIKNLHLNNKIPALPSSGRNVECNRRC